MSQGVSLYSISYQQGLNSTVTIGNSTWTILNSDLASLEQVEKFTDIFYRNFQETPIFKWKADDPRFGSRFFMKIEDYQGILWIPLSGDEVASLSQFIAIQKGNTAFFSVSLNCEKIEYADQKFPTRITSLPPVYAAVENKKRRDLDGKVMRDSCPKDKAGFLELKNSGVNTIISLCDEDGCPTTFGFKRILVALHKSSPWEVTDEQIALMIQEIEAAQGRVIIYCKDGTSCTGLIAAILDYARGKDPGSASEEILRFADGWPKGFIENCQERFDAYITAHSRASTFNAALKLDSLSDEDFSSLVASWLEEGCFPLDFRRHSHFSAKYSLCEVSNLNGYEHLQTVFGVKKGGIPLHTQFVIKGLRQEEISKVLRIACLLHFEKRAENPEWILTYLSENADTWNLSLIEVYFINRLIDYHHLFSIYLRSSDEDALESLKGQLRKLTDLADFDHPADFCRLLFAVWLAIESSSDYLKGCPELEDGLQDVELEDVEGLLVKIKEFLEKRANEKPLHFCDLGSGIYRCANPKSALEGAFLRSLGVKTLVFLGPFQGFKYHAFGFKALHFVFHSKDASQLTQEHVAQFVDHLNKFQYPICLINEDGVGTLGIYSAVAISRKGDASLDSAHEELSRFLTDAPPPNAIKLLNNFAT